MTTFKAVLLCLLCSTSAFAQSGKSLDIKSSFASGDKGMQDVVSGKEMSLKSLKQEHGLLVIFTCNTCPFVIKNQGRTFEMLAVAAANKVGVALINSNEAQRDDADSEAAMKAYAREQRYPNYLMDKQSFLADYFGAGHTPEVFLFNNNDELVYKGAMDDSPSDPTAAKQIYLKNAISHMVAGKEITPNSTKSIGCSIKRVK